MTLEQIFFISQTIAAVAVVASIIYLAREVSQSERVQRATMQQGRADRASKAALATASPELARIWQKGTSWQPDLNEQEFTQWMLLCRAAFLSGEDSFMQHRDGLLDEPAFESYVAGVRYYMVFPGMRAIWKLTSKQFGPDFRAFVDGMIAESATAPAPELYSMWQELLQAEPRTAKS
jgi:hypothetical protein